MIWMYILACSIEEKNPEEPRTEREEIEERTFPARIWRHTEKQYRNTVFARTGIHFEGELPIDYNLHGYTHVGSGEVTIAPYDLELYEKAAWTIAEEKIPNMESIQNMIECAFEREGLAILDGEERWNTSCIDQWIVELSEHFWSHAITVEEKSTLQTMFINIAEETHALLSSQAVYASFLLSPHFLFRTEVGEYDEEGKHRLTGVELANRLSYFLTLSPPDDLLMTDARTGALHNEDVLTFHTERLLEGESAKEALTAFFHQTLDIEHIHTMDKNLDLYPFDSPSLREAMVTELDALFWSSVESGDFRTLLTSNEAYLNSELSELYGLGTLPEESWKTLPPEQQRGGLLGRAGFLALNATSLRSSPTHRGKFIRTRLLCHEVPPPPEGVVASLDGVDPSLSLREQLEVHMSDPACSSCHMLMDPLGFPLEHFDAMGQWRSTDNNINIDATGSLDGVDVDGAQSLGLALIDHQRFGYCMTAQLTRFATGHLEGPHQERYLEQLSDSFISGGYSFQHLVVSLVLSDPFRYLSGTIDGEACSEYGSTRACDSECGEGTETCVDGVWQGCDAPVVSRETCDGIDQGCDSQVDDIIQSCTNSGTLGVQECIEGDWNTCIIVEEEESCDGIDNDNDGLIDEDMDVEFVSISFSDLQTQHPACDPSSDPFSGPCNAASHRFCNTRGCNLRTGYGPIAVDVVAQRASLVCLDESQTNIMEATYTELNALLHWCSQDDPVGANCNASINRYCNAQGLQTGFGPLEHSGDLAFIACTPKATKHQVHYDELSAFQPFCYWPGQRDSESCRTAIHQWCTQQGYKTGFGPLENSDNQAQIACIPQGEE